MLQTEKLETRPERLWREYVDAQRRAMETMALDDGIAAGRAWSQFLAEFVPVEGGLRDQVHGRAGADRK